MANWLPLAIDGSCRCSTSPGRCSHAPTPASASKCSRQQCVLSGHMPLHCARLAPRQIQVSILQSAVIIQHYIPRPTHQLPVGRYSAVAHLWCFLWSAALPCRMTQLPHASMASVHARSTCRSQCALLLAHIGMEHNIGITFPPQARCGSS